MKKTKLENTIEWNDSNIEDKTSFLKIISKYLIKFLKKFSKINLSTEFGSGKTSKSFIIL